MYLKMYLKMNLSFLFSLLFFSFSSYAQLEYSLSECTYYFNLNGAQGGVGGKIIERNSSSEPFLCYYDSAPIPQPEISGNIYHDEIISCPDGGNKGCLAGFVCTSGCVTPLSTRQADSGHLVFNGGEDSSICHVDLPNLNLKTSDARDINFVSGADGINEDCRELLRLYQLQLGRPTVSSNFDLPASTAGI